MISLETYRNHQTGRKTMFLLSCSASSRPWSYGNGFQTMDTLKNVMEQRLRYQYIGHLKYHISRMPRPIQCVFAFLDPLLHRATLVIELNHITGFPAKVSNYESYPLQRLNSRIIVQQAQRKGNNRECRNAAIHRGLVLNLTFVRRSKTSVAFAKRVWPSLSCTMMARLSGIPPRLRISSVVTFGFR